jgi:hypothetical protein
MISPQHRRLARCIISGAAKVRGMRYESSHSLDTSTVEAFSLLARNQTLF